MPLLRSDSAGYLVTPGKNSKGKLPESYKQIIEKAEKIGNQSTDLAIKQKAQDIVDKVTAQAASEAPKVSRNSRFGRLLDDMDSIAKEDVQKPIRKTEDIKSVRGKASPSKNIQNKEKQIPNIKQGQAASSSAQKLIEQLNQDEAKFYEQKIKNDFRLTEKASMSEIYRLEKIAEQYRQHYKNMVGTRIEERVHKQLQLILKRIDTLKQVESDLLAFKRTGGKIGDKGAYEDFLKKRYFDSFEQGRQMVKGIPPVPPPPRLSKEKKDDIREYTKRANEILGDKSVSVFVAIGNKNIESVLSDRFYNTLENNSRGMDYAQSRYLAESRIFGIQSGNPPPPYSRPIYWYLQSSNQFGIPDTSHTITDPYGDVKVELKREVFENNSTFLKRDSLDHSRGNSTAGKYGVDTSNVWIDSNLQESPNNINDLRGDFPYIEAQVYGVVDASKIAAIHYPSELKVPPSVRKLARKHQIKIIIHGESKWLRLKTKKQLNPMLPTGNLWLGMTQFAPKIMTTCFLLAQLCTLRQKFFSLTHHNG